MDSIMRDMERLKPLGVTFLVVLSIYILYSFIPYALAQDTDWDEDEEEPEAPGCCGALFCFAFLAPLLIPLIFIFIGVVMVVGIIMVIVWAVKKSTK